MAYTDPMVWEVVFMLVVLKIPIVYLCLVVWWAVRAEPDEGAPPLAVRVVLVDDTPPTASRPAWRRPSGRRPGPTRRPGRGRAHAGRVGAFP
jgi:hypothetical protein